MASIRNQLGPNFKTNGLKYVTRIFRELAPSTHKYEVEALNAYLEEDFVFAHLVVAAFQDDFADMDGCSLTVLFM